MKVLFIAKFGNHDNCDEEAIAFALEKLGHQVIRIDERPKYRRGIDPRDVKADCLLFLKWEDVRLIKGINLPKFFWYFDLVNSNDPSLAARCEFRVNWMANILPLVDVGFCTDGDWVYSRKYHSDITGRNADKLYHLMQGADERVMGTGVAQISQRTPILFTGMVHHGRSRAEHIAELRDRYGTKFKTIGDSGPNFRKHGRDLADEIAQTDIVLAPDGPNTDLYFSNRIYLVLGFGGFLLHPYCRLAAEHYKDGRDLVFYNNRRHCNELIDHYLKQPYARQQIALQGLKTTWERHTYRHRCMELMRVIEDRI